MNVNVEFYPKRKRSIVEARFGQVLILQELTALEWLFLGPAVRHRFAMFYL